MQQKHEKGMSLEVRTLKQEGLIVLCMALYFIICIVLIWLGFLVSNVVNSDGPILERALVLGIALVGVTTIGTKRLMFRIFGGDVSDIFKIAEFAITVVGTTVIALLATGLVSFIISIFDGLGSRPSSDIGILLWFSGTFTAVILLAIFLVAAFFAMIIYSLVLWFIFRRHNVEYEIVVRIIIISSTLLFFVYSFFG